MGLGADAAAAAVISDDLDYRHLADEDRYPVYIGRSAIANLNARHFPEDMSDAPAELLDAMGAERRAVYREIVEGGAAGITGPELIARLPLRDYQVRTQINKLARAHLIYSQQVPGSRGHQKRYWAY